MVNKIQKYKSMNKVEAKSNIATKKVKDEPMYPELNPNEVVEEYKVFISHDVAKSLLLLKHTHLPPHHHFSSTESDESSKYKRLAAKYKPRHNAFEYFQQVDTKVNCDEVKAEEIAEYVNDEFKSRVQDKDIYTSSYIEPQPGAMMMAGYVGDDNNITFTPIAKKLHMNISLNHLDVASKRKGEKDKENMRGEGNSAKIPYINHSKETEAQREAREKSFHTYLENFNSEVWQNLNFFEEDSPESEEERQKLEYIVDEERIEQMGNTDNTEMTAEEYFLQHHPKIDRKDAMESNPTKQDLNKILTQIFTRAQVVNFKILEEICRERKLETGSDLLKRVKDYADVLRGRLVVKSNVLYPNKEKSPFVGMETSRLIHVRNYILCSFYYGNGKIDRSKLYQDLRKIDRRELDTVINSIAEFDNDSCNEWKLQLTNEKSLEKMLSQQEIETGEQIWSNMFQSSKKILEIS